MAKKRQTKPKNKALRLLIGIVAVAIFVVISLMIWYSAQNVQTGSTADSPTSQVCYGDATQVYSILDATHKPVTMQGQVIGWINFENGNLNKANGNNPLLPAFNDPIVEGNTYTMDLTWRFEPQSAATVTIVGFRCGEKFYYYIRQPGSIFID